MQDPKALDSRPPISPPTRRTSSTGMSPPTVVQEEVKGYSRDEEKLGYNTVPYKDSVNALSLPSSIGTAVAASAAFTILTADSILGDDSPDALVRRRAILRLLVRSTGYFAAATAITICLQVLYGSPSFCEILVKKVHHKFERRTPFERSFRDLMRYVVAYTAVAGCYLAVLLHLLATIFTIEAFKYYAHDTWVAQLAVVAVSALGLFGFAISAAIEQPIVEERWRKLLCLPTSSQSHEMLTEQSPQAEPKDFPLTE